MSITAIILDWAGTAVDYGSFAPVEAFRCAFEHFSVQPSIDEIRAPMGMQKRAHIAQMLEGERLGGQWQAAHGRAHTPNDVDAIYARFEPALFAVLSQHAEPLPEVLDTIAKIRAMGIKIGSTTGYTKKMMDIVAPAAKQYGYCPDCLVCPEDVGGQGRPAPYMLWENLRRLGVQAIGETLKIGDTAADMQEAKAAGCRCAGVLLGSSMLGLSQEEADALNEQEKAERFADAARRYKAAGADFVLRDITQLPQLIAMLS